MSPKIVLIGFRIDDHSGLITSKLIRVKNKEEPIKVKTIVWKNNLSVFCGIALYLILKSICSLIGGNLIERMHIMVFIHAISIR
jgi:hypothetical protein